MTKQHIKDVVTAANGVTLEHRHFAFIAATIRTMPDDGYPSREDVARLFADACKETNPRFQRARFLAACDAS